MSIEQIIWIGFAAILTVFIIGLLWFALLLRSSYTSAKQHQHQSNKHDQRNWFFWGIYGILGNWLARALINYLTSVGIPPLQAQAMIFGPCILILILLGVLRLIQGKQQASEPFEYSPPSAPSPQPVDPDLGPFGPPLPPFHTFERELELVEVGSLVDCCTRNRLHHLLNGDHALAERLVQNAKYNYPCQSEQWLWEKVIFDLERDRQ